MTAKKPSQKEEKLVSMICLRKCFGELVKDENGVEVPKMYLPGDEIKINKETANKWNDAGVAKVVIE